MDSERVKSLAERRKEARARYDSMSAAGKRDWWVDQAEAAARGIWGEPDPKRVESALKMARYWREQAEEVQDEAPIVAALKMLLHQTPEETAWGRCGFAGKHEPHIHTPIFNEGPTMPVACDGRGRDV